MTEEKVAAEANVTLLAGGADRSSICKAHSNSVYTLGRNDGLRKGTKIENLPIFHENLRFETFHKLWSEGSRLTTPENQKRGLIEINLWTKTEEARCDATHC
jgi:hypothetical protein